MLARGACRGLAFHVQRHPTRIILPHHLPQRPLACLLANTHTHTRTHCPNTDHIGLYLRALPTRRFAGPLGRPRAAAGHVCGPPAAGVHLSHHPVPGPGARGGPAAVVWLLSQLLGGGAGLVTFVALQLPVFNYLITQFQALELSRWAGGGCYWGTTGVQLVAVCSPLGLQSAGLRSTPLRPACRSPSLAAFRPLLSQLPPGAHVHQRRGVPDNGGAGGRGGAAGFGPLWGHALRGLHRWAAHCLQQLMGAQRPCRGEGSGLAQGRAGARSAAHAGGLGRRLLAPRLSWTIHGALLTFPYLIIPLLFKHQTCCRAWSCSWAPSSFWSSSGQSSAGCPTRRTFTGAALKH